MGVAVRFLLHDHSPAGSGASSDRALREALNANTRVNFSRCVTFHQAPAFNSMRMANLSAEVVRECSRSTEAFAWIRSRF